MAFARLVDAESGHARLETEFADLLERLVVFYAPVKVHDDVVDVEVFEGGNLLGTADKDGDDGTRVCCVAGRGLRGGLAKLYAVEEGAALDGSRVQFLPFAALCIELLDGLLA